MQELEVWLLEEHFGRSIWIAGVGDDDVKFALAIGQVLEAVLHESRHVRVLEAHRHSAQVLLAEPDDRLVDIHKNCLLHRLVLDDLSQYTAIAAANNKNLLRVWVGV